MSTIALIDGDVLVYRAGFSVEENTDWGDGTHSLWADEQRGKETVDTLVGGILDAVKAHKYYIALTCHNTPNFRKAIFPLYKENRTSTRKPLLWKFLRDYLTETYQAQTRDNLEGDDVLGIWATKPWTGNPNRIVVSVDKDFKSIPCTFYNMKTKERVVIDEAQADYNFYLQTLVGDSTDNYPGCQGIGPKKGHSILSNALRQGCPAWKAVVLTYKKAGFGEDFALTQARCARILRASDYDFTTKQPILWTPPAIQEVSSEPSKPPAKTKSTAQKHGDRNPQVRDRRNSQRRFR